MMLCFRIYLVLVLFLIISCDRGGNILMVGSISGPDEVPEGTTVEYSVDAEDDSGITYGWIVNPVGYGTLGTPTTASTTFTAPEVDSDFGIAIVVVVNSDNDGPVVRSLDVIVKDVAGPPAPPVNHPPIAAAHADDNEINVGDSLQFYNDSTDPDGDDDIVLWEWDFSYDPDDGFQVESEEQEPLHAYVEEGVYLVQLLIIDAGGLSDMLDDPLEISVEWGPRPPVAAAHADTYSGDPGLEIQFYDDSTDPDGNEDIVLWEWDFSYDPDDGFIVENIEIEPLVVFPEFGIYDIQLRVTDSADQFDFLDEPLQIHILPDHPYASYGFTFGAERATESAKGVGVDPQGNVYLAGLIGKECIDVEPGDGIFELYPDSRSACIIKYGQPDFEVIDATFWEVSKFKRFTGDRNGNFFISGEYTGEHHFAYEEDGAFIWSITPSNLNNWRFLQDNYYGFHPWFPDEVWYSEKYYFSPVAVNENGDIFYTESVWIFDYEYGDSIDFNIYKGSVSTDPDDFLKFGTYQPPSTNQTSIGAGSHGFLVLSYVSSNLSELAHFSLDGTHQWEIETTHQSDFLYTSIQSDAEGNYYILHINDNNVTCISPDGDIIRELLWDAYTSEIYVYDDGSFIVTGTFKDTVDFDPGPKEAFMLSPGRWSGYISVFDSNGNFQWVETWGYSTYMGVYGIAVDHLGNIFVCGSFKGSIDLGPPWQSDIHYSNGYQDAFVLKLSQ